MRISIEVGDVLQAAADVLISTANPWLNLSGGVNGAILLAVGLGIQEELHAHLKQVGVSALPAGSVVRSSSGSLQFQSILHAVAIDPFYDSSVEIVRSTLASALEMAIKLGASSVASPALATGYGPLSIDDFGQALAPLTIDPRFENLAVTIVVRSEENAKRLKDALAFSQAAE